MKQVIGGEGPVKIEAPVVAGEALLAGSAEHSFLVPEGHALAILVLEGEGLLRRRDGGEHSLGGKDFVVARAQQATRITLTAGSEGVRIFAVQVPLVPDYHLMSEG